MAALYFLYWGKAKPEISDGPAYHLLPFHCLDVAAVAEMLLEAGIVRLEPLARYLGLSGEAVRQMAVFFAALHDLGKFARAFQGLIGDLSPNLVAADPSKHYRERHDTLGWLLWRDILQNDFPDPRLPVPASEFWNIWLKAVTGHHGMPPKEATDNSVLGLDARDHFLPEDIAAAREFVADVAAILLPAGLPKPEKAMRTVLRQHSWQLAGLAVLADWIGSNQEYFRYCDNPRMPLTQYWEEIARPVAKKAVMEAGLAKCAVLGHQSPADLFGYLRELTPLQRYASEVPLAAGPQLFLLEDVTGAGKTEAALILAYRLMAAGLGDGIYFGLPSMATANQMYRRVGKVYRRFYAADAHPSLILAHGARELIDEFRLSVSQPADRDYQSGEPSATAQCTAWLADNRKKALLADVGVGTLDQVLLAILPARHQSLRLLGVARKILIVDEVHAYDPYMGTLLHRLLWAHARQGGSAVLLSATLPSAMRADLVGAFQKGQGVVSQTLPLDRRYPLATHVHQHVDAVHCETRRQLRRTVAVRLLDEQPAVLALIREQAAAGRCVCWIRNTVDDARDAYSALQPHIDAQKLTLFHSRYAMGDRLDIEDRVLAALGKESCAEGRAGRVLVGTQVLEQSLDFDVDVMVSDLAPIDLLIQRAGRLQRHARDGQGNPALDGVERRPEPVFYVYGPKPSDTPAANWYASVFPKARYVYPDAGRLWLTQKALLAAGRIVTPGEFAEPGAVRELIEMVYGEESATVIPEALEEMTRKCYGEVLGKQGLAGFNALDFDKGYCRDSSKFWDEDARIPTRLADETATVYLAQEDGEGLRPFVQAERHAWELSAVRLNAKKLKGLAPEWERRFAERIAALRERYKVLAEPAFVLVLEKAGRQDCWTAQGIDAQGRVIGITYERALGLCLEDPSGAQI